MWKEQTDRINVLRIKVFKLNYRTWLNINEDKFICNRNILF